MATTKDATWIQRKLAVRNPHITITATIVNGVIVVTGTSPLGTFTERSDSDIVNDTDVAVSGIRDVFYRAIVGYFDDLNADTIHARATTAPAVVVAPTLPYPVLPLTDHEPAGRTSPDPEEGIDYIGCGVCVDWDVSYLSADGHLYDTTPISDEEAGDMLAGYTACNRCGRVYPNAHRYLGPLPTLARIDITSNAWRSAHDLYNQRTFGIEPSAAATGEPR